jgi:hypothetical protein
VCCPTADHLPVLKSILALDPQARILLEKPACQGHEIDAFTALLATHRSARVTVTDQYRHARALSQLTQLIAETEPGSPASYISVAFTKDRSRDIAQGRFIDRSYGILGYEWLHMLAILREILPEDSFTAYLSSDPGQAELRATYDPRLFVSALTEHTRIRAGDTDLQVDLTSSITSASVLLTSAPCTSHEPASAWQRALRPPDDRHRHVTVYAGHTRFQVHLDPVTTADDWQLDRNQHRITAERDGRMIHDQVIEDSPLHTAITSAVSALTSTDPVPAPDLGPLRRIAVLAELLRARQPHDASHGQHELETEHAHTAE